MFKATDGPKMTTFLFLNLHWLTATADVSGCFTIHCCCDHIPLWPGYDLWANQDGRVSLYFQTFIKPVRRDHSVYGLIRCETRMICRVRQFSQDQIDFSLRLEGHTGCFSLGSISLVCLCWRISICFQLESGWQSRSSNVELLSNF